MRTCILLMWMENITKIMKQNINDSQIWEWNLFTMVINLFLLKLDTKGAL